jgi:hypothetical protein
MEQLLSQCFRKNHWLNNQYQLTQHSFTGGSKLPLLISLYVILPQVTLRYIVSVKHVRSLRIFN